jgi:hypothetical protein
MIQTLALKIGLALAIGACGATWFAADAHYSKQYAALKAGYEQAAKDQKAVVDKTIAENTAVTEDINGKAQQISSMGTVLGDLSVRLDAANHRPVRLCPAAAGAIRPYLDPIGPAITASDRPAPAVAEPDIGIARGVVSGALEVGIDALKAELFWREYARRTGQAKP